MGTKLTALALLALFLTGCSPHTTYQPYYLTESGERVYAGQESSPVEKQALEYCTDDDAEPLYNTSLNFYTGNLASISNYRERLLAKDFDTKSIVKTPERIDEVLSNGFERVRLIYTSSGTIRIVFENPEGVAHILLEEV